MRRIVSIVLCLSLAFCLSSCDDKTSVLVTEKTVAVKYGSANEIACKKYVSDGYKKVTYNSSSDVVLAVENGKADFGILDEFELNSYIIAGRNIKKNDSCQYSLDYCAYFSSENEVLQKSFNEAIKQLKADGTLERIKKTYLQGENYSNIRMNNENGTLTMLCDPCFENRVYADDGGEITGMDVTIAREICNYLGYDLEIITADFDELFIKLDDGEGDFIISACEVDEDRKKYYLASNAYFTLNYYLVERNG